jgi:membrane dipeptidase
MPRIGLPGLHRSGSLIVDGHEDLALNVLADGRDYLTSAHAIRATETAAGFESASGTCMLGLADWLEARVAVVIATVTVIPREEANQGEPSYVTPEAAYRQARAQLQIYRDWDAEHEQIALVESRQDLDRVLASWDGSGQPQVGIVLLMENADPIRTPEEAAWWWENGLRLIGPAWHTNRYSGSSMSGGPLTDEGRRLLDEMDRLGFVLDVTHMSDEAAREALARYGGTVVATHANSRRTVERPRLLRDDVVQAIAGRDGVIGILPLLWALDPDWQEKGRAGVSLEAVVDAVDVLVELTGDTRHLAIGTDFDGGQGVEQAPHEVDTIADLPKLADALERRGYTETDVRKIMSGNWLRVLERALPSL